MATWCKLLTPYLTQIYDNSWRFLPKILNCLMLQGCQLCDVAHDFRYDPRSWRLITVERFVEGKSSTGMGFSPSTLVLPISIIPPILSIHLHLGTAVTRKTSRRRPETFKQCNVPSIIRMCMQKKSNSKKQRPSRDADSASARQEICHILWKSKVHFPAPNSLNLSLP